MDSSCPPTYVWAVTSSCRDQGELWEERPDDDDWARAGPGPSTALPLASVPEEAAAASEAPLYDLDEELAALEKQAKARCALLIQFNSWSCGAMS